VHVIVGDLIAALTREHGGWEQACLRTSDERSRVQCLVPARGACRGKALDEVGAPIPGDAERRQEQVILSFLDISTFTFAQQVLWVIDHRSFIPSVVC
jgi:hypothetical protein